jgi:PAS domain S-box-containing protein
MRNPFARIVDAVRWLDANERRRLAAHGVGLGAVAAALVVRWALGVTTDEPQFWLFSSAIAVSAALGGAAPALVAALASLLSARIIDGATLTAGLLFVAEGLAVASVVLLLRTLLEQERHRMTALEPWMIELKSSERQGRLVDSAFSQLDEAAADTVVVTLDRSGRVSGWRAGATRLYGIPAVEIIGASPARLFVDVSDDDFARLVAEARQNEAGVRGRQARADGSTFEAEVRIRPLSRGGFDGFVMIVRDLTDQQAYLQLQHEADAANRQLWTLRHLTDPSLNSLDGEAFASALLDRLRASIDAEGVALVYMEKFRRRVMCAASGLQSERGVYRPPLDLRRADAGRTLMIHNDAAAVAESSAAGWPADVTSMMAMPVVHGGTTQAMVEVVYRTGRRATEWEIALVQVAAARIAGFLRDPSYADSGAVA